MAISVICDACNQTLAAPEAMAGKKAVCPNCKAVIAIPEQFVPAEIADPDPLETRGHRSIDPELAASLDITQAALTDPRAAEEKAALQCLRYVYLFCRDDWRRLLTCPHLWFAFILFFLPWVNISCNGRTLVTQTGLQTCHGASTVEPRFDRLERRGIAGENVLRPRLDEPPPWSALSIIYITFVCLGGFVGFVASVCVCFRLHTFAAATHLFSLGLGSAAFLALGSQMVIGFPIDKHTKQMIEKAKADQDRQNARFGIMRPQEDAFDAWFDVEAKYTLWLWLSAIVTFVSVPAFLLEFVVLIGETVRKHLRRRPDS